MSKIKLGDIVYVDVMQAARKCRVIGKRRFTYLLQTLGALGDTNDDTLENAVEYAEDGDEIKKATYEPRVK